MTYSDYAIQFIGVKQGSKRHKKIIDGYNQITPLPRGYRVKYSDAWCSTFVSYILYKCKCKHKIYECSADKMYIKCKKYLIDDDVQINDLIFYDWNNDKHCDHVGIVQRVTKKYVYVIEGNKDRAVGIRKILRNSKYIRAVARV